MATVTFGGLATGLDVNALIDGLLGVERVRITAMQAEQVNVNSAKDSISGFSSKLSALKDAATELMSPVKFASFNATTSDSAIAASVVGVPSAGSYSLEVQALAKEQRTYSTAQASSTTALGMAGNLSLTVGAGAPVDVAITATDTLTDIAAKISQSGAKVTASVIFDGTNYRMQVRGKETGAANAVTFGGVGAALGLTNPANTMQTASDAQITLDGISITRPTNQVSGVVPGVTLALSKVTTGPVDVTVESDPDALREKIETFVTAYNSVVSAGHLAAGFGTVKAANSVLAGDSAIRMSLDRISRVIGQSVAGTSGKYTSLMSVGLASKNDGTIALDATKLNAALSANPDAVAKLFVEDPTIGATGAMDDMAAAVNFLIGTSTSVITGRIDALATRSTRIDKDVAKMEERLSVYEDQLRAQFTQLELLVSGYQAQGNALAGMTAGASSK